MKPEPLPLRRLVNRIVIFLALVFFSHTAFSDCQPQSDWFPHSKTPEPDHQAFASRDNCEFHQWSWQMFLWLTSEVDGKPRFLSMMSPYDLLGVSSEGLMPRMQKSNQPESFNEYLQAGTDGVLVDQDGKAVYYSQYLDKDFVQFIRDNDLADPSTVRDFDPETPFPVGSVELKVSWKILQPGERHSDMFVMTGEVNRFENRNGKIVVNPDKTQTVKLGLVGFHVAGVVKGHPEMIWATFEHQDNAPDVPRNVKADTVVSDKDWTFYKAGTTYRNCNVNLSDTNKLTLDEDRQTLNPPTQVCRQFQFGNDPSDSGVKTNDNNIVDLNKGVRKQLDSDDVWRHYHEVGAIWFNQIDALKPGMSLANDELLTGSLKLSNSTVETYTQDQSTMNNCFRCHNTRHAFPRSEELYPLPELDLNISHAFRNIYFWSQDKTDEE